MQPENALALYEQHINAHDFDLLVPVISDEATFWFNDGSHTGLLAIRAAFERTWAAISNETYWLDQRQWIARSEDAAACLYRFNWQGTVNGTASSGQGRGTTVLRREADGWKIVHEHLSSMP